MTLPLWNHIHSYYWHLSWSGGSAFGIRWWAMTLHKSSSNFLPTRLLPISQICCRCHMPSSNRLGPLKGWHDIEFWQRRVQTNLNVCSAQWLVMFLALDSESNCLCQWTEHTDAVVRPYWDHREPLQTKLLEDSLRCKLDSFGFQIYFAFLLMWWQPDFRIW